METPGADVAIMSLPSAKTVCAENLGPISRITTTTEAISGSTKKHRWNVLSRIEHPHPLDSLSCLAWVDSIAATNGAKPHEYFTIP